MNISFIIQDNGKVNLLNQGIIIPLYRLHEFVKLGEVGLVDSNEFLSPLICDTFGLLQYHWIPATLTKMEEPIPNKSDAPKILLTFETVNMYHCIVMKSTVGYSHLEKTFSCL